MSQLISRVVVGSRLHNLHDEDSDWDTREVVASPLSSIISPFQTNQVKQTNHKTGDDVRFELSHFVKLLVQGNPTMLEILWSTMVEESSWAWRDLHANKGMVLDSRRIYDAHRGYAHNQLKRGAVPTETALGDWRRGKLTAGALRGLAQGIDLLTHGTFSPRVTDRPEWGLPTFHQMLKELRGGCTLDEYANLYVPIARDLEARLDDAFEANPDRLRPSISALEDYLYEVYTEELNRC